MSDARHTIRVSPHLLLFKEGKVLLSRRAHTGYADGYYSVPAGHLEADETTSQCLIREAAEEIGIQLVPTDLTMAHTMFLQSNHDYIDFFFVATSWQGEVINNEPEKCDALLWADPEALPEPLLPYLNHVFTCLKNKLAYSEYADTADLSS